MSKQITVQALKASIDAETKVAASCQKLFREYLGFPDNSPETMETLWKAWLAYITSLTGNDADKLRYRSKFGTAMTSYRHTCATPYRVGKDKDATITLLTKGEIVALADKKAAKSAPKGAIHKISDTEPPKIVEVVKEIPIPMGELEVMDRFAELANLFLTKEDVTVVSRLIAAMRFNWGKTAKKSKTTRK